MKKFISLFVLAMLIPLTSGIAVQTVYICSGPNSAKYHASSNCKGLNRCSTDISAINYDEAIKMGRTACKICY